MVTTEHSWIDETLIQNRAVFLIVPRGQKRLVLVRVFMLDIYSSGRERPLLVRLELLVLSFNAMRWDLVGGSLTTGWASCFQAFLPTEGSGVFLFDWL